MYNLLTNASNYAYSCVLTQAVDGADDMRPIVYTSVYFSDAKQRLCATEKEAFAVYQPCIPLCGHKPLEPFLSSGMRITRPLVNGMIRL